MSASDPASTTRLVKRRGGGPPVYTYEAAPGVVPISVMSMNLAELRDEEQQHAHAHDFLVLAYFERGGGTIRVGERHWPIETGDAYVVAPGEVVGARVDRASEEHARGFAVYFPVDGLGAAVPDALLSWRAHPLLFLFARGEGTGVQRLAVPPDDRATWSARLRTLDTELHERRDGYAQAAVAHLTLLLVDAARLAAGLVDDLRVNGEPLLAEVFRLIENRYDEPISLRDVARGVNLSAGYLTTIVRQRTGRTVLEWITQRRLSEARRLLVTTDLAVEEIARRVGYTDPAYFVRAFRRAHGTTPLRWRRAGREPFRARSERASGAEI